jgi:hypothetical protein
MEEGEFSDDDDDDDDMNGLQNNSEKKDNDTNEDRVKVTEVVDITEISSSKTEISTQQHQLIDISPFSDDVDNASLSTINFFSSL